MYIQIMHGEYPYRQCNTVEVDNSPSNVITTLTKTFTMESHVFKSKMDIL